VRFLTEKDYKTVEKSGITSVLLNKGRILLVERRRIPFMTHPGFWSFVSGARKNRNEEYMDTVYREIKEETDMEKSQLKLLVTDETVIIRDHRKNIQWENKFFIFDSKTDTVRLDMENKNFKWISIDELERHKNITLDYFVNKDRVLDLIKSCLK
jgi:8-oxo-dGTP pyrophosphatase MutT (NUDIX family)